MQLQVIVSKRGYLYSSEYYVSICFELLIGVLDNLVG